MIRVKRVRTLPLELLAVLTEPARQALAEWREKEDTYLTRSPMIYYFTENGRPLIAVGAMRLTCLASEAEIWLFPSIYLRPRHLRDLKRMFDLFRNHYYTGPELFATAKANFPQACRFIQFFGGRCVETRDDKKIYRWA